MRLPLLSVLLMAGLAPSAAACSLAWHSTIPLLIQASLPTVPAEINGNVVGMIVDSGSGSTMVTPEAARQLGLRPVKDYERSASVSGVGGGAFYEVDGVQTLRLVEPRALHGPGRLRPGRAAAARTVPSGRPRA